MDNIISVLGDSRVSMGGIFVIFVLAIVIALYNDDFFGKNCILLIQTVYIFHIYTTDGVSQITKK